MEWFGHSLFNRITAHPLLGCTGLTAKSVVLLNFFLKVSPLLPRRLEMYVMSDSQPNAKHACDTACFLAVGCIR